MAIADDFQISVTGDIRYTGTTDNYTVIAFHRWLGDLMDQAQASGNDLLDITDATASARSTDNIITLNAPYNIDDTAAQHLYDGSIIQNNGDEIYDGILVFAPAGTPLQIIQNGLPAYPNFWDTGLNADATNGISHRFMLKVRTAGANIDGTRVRGQTRAVGFTHSEFNINATARGNNVIALSYASDLNNATAESTIRSWTNITNTEGYAVDDIDNDGNDEPYYSAWERDTRTINQFYERMKWLARESTIEDFAVEVGSDFPVGNGTILGQAQSFQNGVNAQYLTRVRVNLKKVLLPTGNLTAKLYANASAHGSGDDIPTGAALATSVNFDVSKLTTAYKEYEIAFTTQYLMAASTDYVIAFEYSGGDASNYVHVQGDVTGTHTGNQSDLVAGPTWTAAAAEDLGFEVYASPRLYGVPGEIFRGVTHEVIIDTFTGLPFTQPEALTWTGGTGQLLAVKTADTTASQTISVVAAAGTYTRSAGNYLTDGFIEGMTVVFSGLANGTNSSARVIQTVTATVITVTSITGLVNETGDANERAIAGHMWIMLKTGIAPTNGQTIAGVTSSATADVNETVTVRPVSIPFVGASTGSAIIGAYGLGITTALTASDKVTDLFNVLNVPPNNVTFTVSGLVSGEDRVLVAPLGYSFAYDTLAGGSFALGDTLVFSGNKTGTGYVSYVTETGTTGRIQMRSLTGETPIDNTIITVGGVTAAVSGEVVPSEDPRQLKLLTTLSGAGETAIVCTASIPTDTPSTGTIRIELDTGIYSRVAYTGYSGSTFTIASTDFSGALTATGGASESGNSIFVSYIDLLASASTASFTGVYAADRNLFIRVRDGGTAGDNVSIKTFETTGVLGSAGGSSTAIRTSDA